jgi:hypothetical protein
MITSPRRFSPRSGSAAGGGPLSRTVTSPRWAMCAAM